MLAAVWGGNADLIELLLSKGANIEASDMVHNIGLQQSICRVTMWSSLFVCVYVLLQWGNTALLLAISMNYIEAARILIEKKAKIHTKNKVGSLLMYLRITY